MEAPLLLPIDGYADLLGRQNPRHSNAARYVDRLVELGYLVDIHLPSTTGGRHKRYLTVACTPADRTGQTLSDIATEAKQFKVRGAEEGTARISANDRATISDVMGGERAEYVLRRFVLQLGQGNT